MPSAVRAPRVRELARVAGAARAECRERRAPRALLDRRGARRRRGLEPGEAPRPPRARPGRGQELAGRAAAPPARGARGRRRRRRGGTSRRQRARAAGVQRGATRHRRYERRARRRRARRRRRRRKTLMSRRGGGRGGGILSRRPCRLFFTVAAGRRVSPQRSPVARGDAAATYCRPTTRGWRCTARSCLRCALAGHA